MNRPSSSPSRPVLIFDGNCRFCRHFIRHLTRLTRDRVEYLPQQDPACALRFPAVDPAALEQSVHRIDSTGRVTSGAEAVALTLAETPGWGWIWFLFRRVPGIAPLSERLYRFTARNRSAISGFWQLVYGEFEDVPRDQGQ